MESKLPFNAPSTTSVVESTIEFSPAFKLPSPELLPALLPELAVLSPVEFSPAFKLPSPAALSVMLSIMGGFKIIVGSEKVLSWLESLGFTSLVLVF